jgi:hypothetical protein
MTDDLVKRLREAADEIARAGHNGWGNTCMEAADALERLSQQAEPVDYVALQKLGWQPVECPVCEFSGAIAAPPATQQAEPVALAKGKP